MEVATWENTTAARRSCQTLEKWVFLAVSELIIYAISMWSINLGRAYANAYNVDFFTFIKPIGL